MLQVFAAFTNMAEGDTLVNCLRTIDLFSRRNKSKFTRYRDSFEL